MRISGVLSYFLSRTVSPPVSYSLPFVNGNRDIMGFGLNTVLIQSLRAEPRGRCGSLVQ